MKLIALFIFLFAGCAVAEPVIIQKPIQFNQERIDLTREYRKLHYGINGPSIVITPQMIILHWTATSNLKKAYDELYPSVLPASLGREDIQAGGRLNVSAHFLIDRNGAIYQLMPTDWMARQVIGLNNVAIGIENVGGVNAKQDLTEAQVNADVFLIRKLVKEYPTIHYLIGHYEYQEFKNSALWQEKNPNYLTQNLDPGPEFMERVRKKVADLDLKSHP